MIEFVVPTSPSASISLSCEFLFFSLNRCFRTQFRLKLELNFVVFSQQVLNFLVVIFLPLLQSYRLEKDRKRFSQRKKIPSQPQRKRPTFLFYSCAFRAFSILSFSISTSFYSLLQSSSNVSISCFISPLCLSAWTDFRIPKAIEDSQRFLQQLIVILIWSLIHARRRPNFCYSKSSMQHVKSHPGGQEADNFEFYLFFCKK